MTQPPTGPEQPDQTPGPQDPYGTPPPPSYGAPSGDHPSAPPPTAPSPYGQAPFGQAPFDQPSGYPPPGAAPSKGLAIGALVSSLVCCLPIATVLGVIVLRRGKDGGDHGKGLAIAAIVINVLAMVASIALFVVAVVFGTQLREVADLEPGDCISADGLREDDASFSAITAEECSEPHDAEVMGMVTLTDEHLATYPDSEYGDLCDQAVAADPDRVAATQRDDVALLFIYDGQEPGDSVACLALAADGGQLDEPLVD